MPKRVSLGEITSILQVLKGFSDGASLEEINQSLSFRLPSYTLQRRLALLREESKVYTKGKARALRYFLAQPTEKEAVVEKTGQNEWVITLSSEAKEIGEKVQKPIQMRQPAFYDRGFLDRYRPNDTFYLDAGVRKELAKLGKTDGIRPAGTYVKQIYHRLLIDLSWNSSRLEGNTYSLLETERLLDLSEPANGKDLIEARMILNHKDAIEFLVNTPQDIGIDHRSIYNLHAMLSNELLGDIQACGRLRSITIAIGGSVYEPLSIPQLIEEIFDQVLDTARAIKDPFEQAFFVMVHLPYLQPFEDVNKRVSRLAANIPLIQQNLSPLSFVGVSQQTYINGLLGVYELNRIDLLRDVFIWAYKRSCMRYSGMRREIGEPDPFRIRYQDHIKEMVIGIVRGCMDKVQAIATIREYAQKFVPQDDQKRFIEEVEGDVMGLHEGNVSCHRLLHSEYEKWQTVWSK